MRTLATVFYCAKLILFYGIRSLLKLVRRSNPQTLCVLLKPELNQVKKGDTKRPKCKLTLSTFILRQVASGASAACGQTQISWTNVEQNHKYFYIKCL